MHGYVTRSPNCPSVRPTPISKICCRSTAPLKNTCQLKTTAAEGRTLRVNQAVPMIPGWGPASHDAAVTRARRLCGKIRVYDQIAILKSGVNAWNAWRRDNRKERRRLREANLRRANLSSAYLPGAN